MAKDINGWRMLVASIFTEGSLLMCNHCAVVERVSSSDV